MWNDIKKFWNDLPVIIQMAGWWFALFVVVGIGVWIFNKMFPENENEEQ